MGLKGAVQVGPWGSSGGASPYEFAPNGKITKIYIRTGGRGGCIDSISFQYIDASTGKECRSRIFGGPGGHLSESMYIDEGEEIVVLSGTVGTYDGWTVITSLRFTTNRKSCEFGSVRGEKFSLPVKLDTAKIVGFHGRFGGYLDSIGAILEPTTKNNHNKSGQWFV